ncbi:DUF3800 domain-containing protein [Hyphobacterium sp.]|uniref:DUF3800 domain-containing protein n=1 Tax=Hyphobacterium sp. TaxID=2004662 RepID=UPI003B517953
MHFIYIDDSTERPVNIFSALCVPCAQWNEAFSRLKRWRTHLKENFGIPLNYELHAAEFLSGRGSSGGLDQLSRHKRAQIFHTSFRVTNWLNEIGVTLFNVCNADDDQFRAFERLLNRINRTMQVRSSHAHLICDEGKEHQYVSLVRKMRVHNHIPSRYGLWDDGNSTRNITLDHIIEDPQFKQSHRSYFIQHADLMAYGLLRRERPTPRIKRYGSHKSFEQLDECLERVCNRNDPYGVIR